MEQGHAVSNKPCGSAAAWLLRMPPRGIMSEPKDWTREAEIAAVLDDVLATAQSDSSGSTPAPGQPPEETHVNRFPETPPQPCPPSPGNPDLRLPGFADIDGEVDGLGYNETSVDIVCVPCPGADPVETWARDPLPEGYF
ncbi:hypothetical protein CTA1_2021 [Colletotrichum tanaceti]|uniref:Uncharacterized protein n=1 Tax=Colletotrichum tanaceti TaxID=1306861 RepID=A0A4U6X2T1_9PEZI|nr:hypothetical protein CTA1_2021 [Colletotrichum tanaceti]